MLENFWPGTALNYAALAIPAFFIFVGLEYLAARQRRSEFFKFDSSIANLSVGIAERLLNLFLTASFYGVFEYVYKHYAIWDIPNTAWVWVVLILATDLVWYWYHRLGHEVNVLWAAHIVHHQSEEFNYTVSARITTFQSLVRNVFWCFLPLAGFHPSMVMVTLVIHGAYSFFTHTQVISRLGWFEYIFITPSHHRVHHASNEKYLNKNYGDLFVFWDKLFGTFQREEEAPVYGLTHPLKSYSFLWQHFHYYMELAYAVRKTRGVLNKLKLMLGKPEALDQNIRSTLEKVYLPHKAPVTPGFRYRAYLAVQTILAVIVLFIVALWYYELPAADIVCGSLFIFITLINCGALLEQRRWMYYLENLRLLLIIGYLSYQFESPGFFLVSMFFMILLMWPMQKWYFKFIYGI